MVETCVLSLSSNFHGAYGLLLLCEKRESISKTPHPRLSAASCRKCPPHHAGRRGGGWVPGQCSRSPQPARSGRRSSSGLLVLGQAPSKAAEGTEGCPLPHGSPCTCQARSTFSSPIRCFCHFISSVLRGHAPAASPHKKDAPSQARRPRSLGLCSCSPWAGAFP